MIKSYLFLVEIRKCSKIHRVLFKIVKGVWIFGITGNPRPILVFFTISSSLFKIFLSILHGITAMDRLNLNGLYWISEASYASQIILLFDNYLCAQKI